MYARVAKQLREHASARAKRARTQIVVLVPLIAAVVFAYSHRRALFGTMIGSSPRRMIV